MAVSIFSRIKSELGTVLERELKDTGIVQEVRTYRSFKFEPSPMTIITTSGTEDEGETVNVTIATIIKFADETEVETAEQVLDDVEQVLINLFGRKREIKAERPSWGAVVIAKASERPASPMGAGFRYSEFYLRFTV